jgi:hypothetical protein
MPAAPPGCFVPVAVRSGQVVSNFVTLAVSSSGTACSDGPSGLPASVVVRATGGEEIRLGAIGVGPIAILEGGGFQFARTVAPRLSALLHVAVSESDVVSLASAYRSGDLRALEAILRSYKSGKSALDRTTLREVRRLVSLDQQGAAAAFGTSRGLSAFVTYFASHATPPGTCIVTTEPHVPYGTHTRGLDAGGTLSLTGPLGQRTMSSVRGQYQVLFGSGFQSPNVAPGIYGVSGTGGRDVPAFNVSLNVPGALVWFNKPDAKVIDRAQPLTVNWMWGNQTGFVLIGGSVHTENANTTMVCVEDAGKGTFTIPPFVLSALPSATANHAYFFLSPHPFMNPVSITGLDLVYFANGSTDYQAVELR